MLDGQLNTFTKETYFCLFIDEEESNHVLPTWAKHDHPHVFFNCKELHVQILNKTCGRIEAIRGV